MEHTECGACCTKTAFRPRPPNKAFVALIVAFWGASLALGFASGAQGWGLVTVASWAALATSVVLFARRATSWTCAECGSAVLPPASPVVTPKAGAFRAMHARHA